MKKNWVAPKLMVHGTLEDLTHQFRIKPKQLGAVDDFGVQGVSS